MNQPNYYQKINFKLLNPILGSQQSKEFKMFFSHCKNVLVYIFSSMSRVWILK